MVWEISNATEAIAICCFDGEAYENGLNLLLGDKIKVTRRNSGWCLGYVEGRENKKGIFPENMIAYIRETKRSSQALLEIDNGLREREIFLNEIEEFFQECRSVIVPFYANEVQMDKFVGRPTSAVFSLMNETYNHRLEIKSQPAMTPALIEENRAKITRNMDKVIELLGLDKIPRTKTGREIDPITISPIEHYMIFEPMDRVNMPTNNHHGLHNKHELSNMFDLKVVIKDIKFDESIKLNCCLEILLSLYDSSNYSSRGESSLPRLSEDFITEKFKLIYPSDKEVKDIEFCFKDLSSQEKYMDRVQNVRPLWLVVQILKRDSLEASKPVRDTRSEIRQPYGFGIKNLGFVKDLQERTTHSEKVIFEILAKQEYHNFSTLQKHFISRNDNNPSVQKCEIRIEFSKLNKNPDVNRYIRDNDPKTDVQKLSFPEKIVPEQLRNDLYIRLEEGKFYKGEKKSQRNVEVVASVRGKSGKIFKECISLGAGEEVNMTYYRSIVYYHSNNPKWNEIFRATFDVNELKYFNQEDEVHVLFQFFHISTDNRKEKEFFGYSYLPLTRSGIIRQDTQETLKVFGTSGRSKDNTDQIENFKYFNPKSDDWLFQNSTPKTSNSSFTVSFKWVSTKWTQSSEVVHFLTWENNTSNLKRIIKELIDKNLEQEIIYHLTDILNGLFKNLIPESFNFLVYILKLINHEKWTHFSDILQAYIDNNFSNMIAYEQIFGTVINLLEQKVAKSIESISGVFSWLMKIAVRSYTLFASYNEPSPESFIELLKKLFSRIPEFFDSINKSVEYERTVGIEFMKTITKCWSIFMKSVTVEEYKEDFATELAQIYSSLFEMVPKSASKMEVHKEWDPAKADCICILISEKEFDLYHKVREVFITLANSYVNTAYYNCSSKTFRYHTIYMLGKFLKNLFNLKMQHVCLQQEVYLLITQVLSTLIAFTSTTSENRRNSNYREVNSISRYSKATISNFDSVDSKKSEGPAPETVYSCMATIFLLMDNNHYETFSSSSPLFILLTKIEALFDKWFDIKNTWASLKRSLCHAYLTALTNLFEVIAMTDSTQLFSSFKIILDELIQSNPSIKSDCWNRLPQTLRERYKDDWEKEEEKFVHSIVKVLQYLVDLREAKPDKDDGFSLRYLTCSYNAVNEFNFNEDAYPRIMSDIYDLHKCSKNFVEAGYTKLEYAKHLSFDSHQERKVKVFNMSEDMTESVRKEKLYSDIISDLNEGCDWEEAIKLCKELVIYYESTFRYKELSAILKRQSEFYQKIYQQRGMSVWGASYYVVALYGKPVPSYLKGKFFIHKFDLFKSKEELVDYIGSNFYSHRGMNINDPFDEDDLNGRDEAIIRHGSVTPIQEKDELLFGQNVPPFIQEYYRYNKIRTFAYDLPFEKGQKIPNNEHLNCYYDRTYYVTCCEFPGIMTWFPVVDQWKEELSPSKVAVFNLRKQFLKLRSDLLKARCQTDISIHKSSLYMTLNGTLMANVNGGPLRYLSLLKQDDDDSLNVSFFSLFGVMREALDELFHRLKVEENEFRERQHIQFSTEYNSMMKMLEDKLHELGKKRPSPNTPIKSLKNKESRFVPVPCKKNYQHSDTFPLRPHPVDSYVTISPIAALPVMRQEQKPIPVRNSDEAPPTLPPRPPPRESMAPPIPPRASSMAQNQ
ncbi:DgyrCDS12801 [Dimorphilus gyrociliatus]|uniref:DgyrCDS12801 n=1 Tax=Dimorphilus gyrociliatus TaxID=2664684 RepID=A0A7I8W8S4_9ANNE|nr:DgyrCDS12801 [Dimorphilus gyrociliatus]